MLSSGEFLANASAAACAAPAIFKSAGAAVGGPCICPQRLQCLWHWRLQAEVVAVVGPAVPCKAVATLELPVLFDGGNGVGSAA